MNPNEFIESLQKYDIEISDLQMQQFNRYFEMLVEANEHVNLTAIVAKEDVYLKHFFDSILPLLTNPDVFIKKSKLIDIGAGAGFPSLPMKILRPDLQVTIVDSLQKRINFLADLTAALNFTDVELVHGRAEDLGQDEKFREKFDIATARAVASLNVLSEYCLPFVKLEGVMVALKGPRGQDEVKEAKNAVKKLGGKIVSNEEIILPETKEIRMITIIEKIVKTPQKYPRKAGVPAKKPL